MNNIPAALIINQECLDIQGIARVGHGVIVLIVDTDDVIPVSAGVELTPQQRREISAFLSQSSNANP